ncbi:MAG TPA: hypothetical protein VFW60_07855 [Rhodanobacteraceae bacterium]|nr:hypothetical protein [Rhodanobacteraceae bacterium]
MDEPKRVTDETTDRLPQHTTPTWEVELLISGVAVFAMLQLPGWLSDKFLFLRPRFDDSWHGVLTFLFAYLTGAAVILAVTFALHLLLRAYWIALVGMHSVYPDGIRWERLRMGPIEREVMQRRDGDFAAMVERADNRASMVFATGVAVAAMLLILTALFAVLFSAASGIALALDVTIAPNQILYICIVVLVAPMILLHLFDRKFGARVRTGGPVRSAAARGFNLYARLGFANRGGVLAMLSSHHGRGRVQAAVVLALMTCILLAALGQTAVRHPELLGNYTAFPQFDSANADTIDSAHYDDQRDPLRSHVMPFIQSAEIDGNYVRLTVPYRPEDDAVAVRKHCPAAATVAETGDRALALLRCLGTLHAVTLDGKPIAGLRYAAGSDPRTDRPALVAMIDVRKLLPGRHELAIARASAPSDEGKAAADDSWIIPFWR